MSSLKQSVENQTLDLKMTDCPQIMPVTEAVSPSSKQCYTNEYLKQRFHLEHWGAYLHRHTGR